MQLVGTGLAGAALAAVPPVPPALSHGSATVQALGQSSAASDPRIVSRITLESIGTYSVDRLNQVLTDELAAFSSFEISYPPARYAVDLYRVTYPSVIPELGNRPTLASGLIAVPDVGGKRPSKLPVVSYQHGSVFAKDEVPSSLENSTETRLMAAIFGGQGYMLVAADYFGKGLSLEPNSYIVKASTEQACLDMLFASQAASGDLGVEAGQLFLSGWSQGGWSTFVFLHKLESVGVGVAAAAVASGPVDLYATVNRWANAWKPIDAVYIPPLQAIMLNAYEQYHALPCLAASAIKPQYQDAAGRLYRNEITIEQAAPLLPTRLPDLLQDEFKAALAIGDNRFSRLLQDSHAYRWRSATPARVYHGGSDEVTPAFIGTLPVGYQAIVGGAEVMAVDAGANADHRGVFLYGMKDQKAWFDQLLE